MHCARQASFSFPRRGGPRPGAGRKPNGRHAGVAHTKRPALAGRHPVHATMRLAPGLPSLRRSCTLALLQRVFLQGRVRAGFRLVHFSIQTNHVHLLVEAEDATHLSRGLQGLAIRIARGLNARWRRRGSVFADRYHARALRTPREVRHALVYVLANARKHGIGYGARDLFSSSAWFDGWHDRHFSRPPHVERPVTQARTWLLTIGWRRYGLIHTREAPRGAHR